MVDIWSCNNCTNNDHLSHYHCTSYDTWVRITVQIMTAGDEITHYTSDNPPSQPIMTARARIIIPVINARVMSIVLITSAKVRIIVTLIVARVTVTAAIMTGGVRIISSVMTIGVRIISPTKTTGGHDYLTNNDH